MRMTSSDVRLHGDEASVRIDGTPYVFHPPGGVVTAGAAGRADVVARRDPPVQHLALLIDEENFERLMAGGEFDVLGSQRFDFGEAGKAGVSFEIPGAGRYRLLMLWDLRGGRYWVEPA